MTDFNKLADALDDTASRSTSLTPDQRLQIIEAARILRAAGAADVGGLMAMVDAIGKLRENAGGAYAENAGHHGKKSELMAAEKRAALESALRVALAPPLMAGGWIEIEQGNLPPLGEQVLVWCKYGLHWGPMVDCWDEQHEAPVSFSSATIPIGPGWDSGSDFYDVTHWMRIGAPVAAAQAGAAQEPKP